jgi:2-aminoadipate transaminase
MKQDLLARRASSLPGALPASPTPGTISFESGHAFPELLPDLSIEAARGLSQHRAETLQYGLRAGLPELRTWIAEYGVADGIDISREHVLVTNGAKQAIELVCRLLLDEGDSIVVTAPTYFSAIPIFRSFGANFIEVGQDRDGLDVRELTALLEQLKREGRASPKLIYCVPEYHNPTGVTMSLERRKALIDLAIREQIFIIEDSPYRKIRFEGPSIPPLKSLDRHDLVFQVGTFSKLMAPGLRVGWVATTPQLVARMTQLKADGGSCPLTQRMIFEFCAAGHLSAHTARVQTIYRTHRDRMVSRLRDELPEISMNVPAGGYYIWLTLPSEMNGDDLTKCATQAGVNVLAPTKCYARPEAGHRKNHIRVAFTHAAPDEIDEGVRRLAAAFKLTPTATPVSAGR